MGAAPGLGRGGFPPGRLLREIGPGEVIAELANEKGTAWRLVLVVTRQGAQKLLYMERLGPVGEWE